MRLRNISFTMSDLIERHLTAITAEGASTNTRKDRGRCLRRLHDDLPFGIAAASTEQIQAWLAYDQWSRWTRYTYAGHIFGFFDWLVANGYLTADEDPTAGMARPKAPRCVPRPATEEQLATALTAPEPLLTAVILAAYAGMRRFEAAAADREHITEDLIFIPVAKGGAPQTVATHPVVWEHVKDRRRGPLLVDEDGHRLTPERLSGMALRWFRSQGLPGFGLHRFRHWYGTMIQREHHDLLITQQALRHSTVTSTQGYALVSNRVRDDAIRSLPRVTPEPASNRLGRHPEA
jgi:integrase/recombinase XerD